MKGTIRMTKEKEKVCSNGQMATFILGTLKMMNEKDMERWSGKMVPNTLENGQEECKMVMAKLFYQVPTSKKVSLNTMNIWDLRKESTDALHVLNVGRMMKMESLQTLHLILEYINNIDMSQNLILLKLR
jgi:hypothetical protein